MGSYHWDKKDTVEDCRSVSISFLRKHDYFCGLMSGGITWTNCYGEQTVSIGVTVSTLDGEYYARFQYTITERDSKEKTEYDYKVSLVTPPCNFGGVRYWFICPLSINGIYCGRRVAKLYLAPRARYFGCGHCYNLSYESRNEPHYIRRGGLYYPLKLNGQIEKMYQQIKRWTCQGRPTRKAQRLHSLQRQVATYL